MTLSLCESCRWMREVTTTRSRFLLCELSKTNPAYQKYPPQPVIRCQGYQQTQRQEAGEAFIAVPLLIRPETAADHEAIRRVNRLAFGQDAEARLVDALRAGGFDRVSLVAEKDGQVVGHIMFSDLPIISDGGAIAALSLAPMAVLPEFERQGIGSALVRRGLGLCREQGHRIVVVLGHPDFYPRFGFSSKLAERLESPYSGGPSFMAAELVPGALGGVVGKVVYPPPFNDL
jgi:putative acetyltransferase